MKNIHIFFTGGSLNENDGEKVLESALNAKSIKECPILKCLGNGLEGWEIHETLQSVGQCLHYTENAKWQLGWRRHNRNCQLLSGMGKAASNSFPRNFYHKERPFIEYTCPRIPSQV